MSKVSGRLTSRKKTTLRYDKLRPMKQKIILAIVALSLSLSAQTTQPQPPQSFCGYTFGEVYTNNANQKLKAPFRYCNRAFISTTTNESRIYYIRIEGSSSGYMSNEDTQTELSRMREIIEEKFGIKMTRDTNSYGYNDPSFKVSARCWQRKNGSRFEVTCTRKDIREADAKSTRHGVQPLPPGVGSEIL